MKVIIIGGGWSGCAIQYKLMQLNIKFYLELTTF